MNERKKSTTFRLTDDNELRMKWLTEYFSNQVNGNITTTDILNEVIKFTSQMLVEKTETKNYVERVNELQKIQSKGMKQFRNNQKRMMRQLDTMIYLVLAQFQNSGFNEDFKINELQSLYHLENKNMIHLMNKISSLVQEDVARGKQIKDSHKK